MLQTRMTPVSTTGRDIIALRIRLTNPKDCAGATSGIRQIIWLLTSNLQPAATIAGSCPACPCVKTLTIEVSLSTMSKGKERLVAPLRRSGFATPLPRRGFRTLAKSAVRAGNFGVGLEDDMPLLEHLASRVSECATKGWLAHWPCDGSPCPSYTL